MNLIKRLTFLLAFLVLTLGPTHVLYAMSYGFRADIIEPIPLDPGNYEPLQWGSPLVTKNISQAVGLEPIVWAQDKDLFGIQGIFGSGWTAEAWASITRVQDFTVSTAASYNLSGFLEGWLYISYIDSNYAKAYVDAYTKVLDMSGNVVTNWEAHSYVSSIGSDTSDLGTFVVPSFMAPGDYTFEQYLKVGVKGDGALAAYSQFGPVPVPAAVWLFGSGLVALMGFSRRRRS